MNQIIVQNTAGRQLIGKKSINFLPFIICSINAMEYLKTYNVRKIAINGNSHFIRESNRPHPMDEKCF